MIRDMATYYPFKTDNSEKSIVWALDMYISSSYDVFLDIPNILRGFTGWVFYKEDKSIRGALAACVFKRAAAEGSFKASDIKSAPVANKITGCISRFKDSKSHFVREHPKDIHRGSLSDLKADVLKCKRDDLKLLFEDYALSHQWDVDSDVATKCKKCGKPGCASECKPSKAGAFDNFLSGVQGMIRSPNGQREQDQPIQTESISGEGNPTTGQQEEEEEEPQTSNNPPIDSIGEESEDADAPEGKDAADIAEGTKQGAVGVLEPSASLILTDKLPSALTREELLYYGVHKSDVEEIDIETPISELYNNPNTKYQAVHLIIEGFTKSIRKALSSKLERKEVWGDLPPEYKVKDLVRSDLDTSLTHHLLFRGGYELGFREGTSNAMGDINIRKLENDIRDVKEAIVAIQHSLSASICSKNRATTSPDLLNARMDVLETDMSILKEHLIPQSPKRATSPVARGSVSFSESSPESNSDISEEESGSKPKGMGAILKSARSKYSKSKYSSDSRSASEEEDDYKPKAKERQSKKKNQEREGPKKPDRQPVGFTF
ncbi:MAG: hypothetical protein FMLXV2_gp2 [Fushun monolepta lauta xinmovirus 2]|uniref:Uncharacterized protein n=1 Tax=Fushun monolepta lauta xinmovirus 2 TaxID=2905555 RepID=A0A8K1XXU5_9MONO|nr:MAG: hypothetical protein FMLXV2_gp2 [Fushun monolepta lauta xinmovirus 2]